MPALASILSPQPYRFKVVDMFQQKIKNKGFLTLSSKAEQPEEMINAWKPSLSSNSVTPPVCVLRKPVI